MKRRSLLPSRFAAPARVLLVVASAILVGPAIAENATPATATDIFLGPADFQGSWIPGPTSPPPWGGQSTFDGAVVISNIAREVVDDVLPSGLRLATNVSSTPDVHPILLIMSHQDDMLFLFPPFDVEYIPSYDELILIVPFVQKQPGTRWHNYVVRMYLDDYTAKVIGNLYYGYAKLLAEFDRDDDVDSTPREFSVRRTGTERFRASLDPEGSWLASDVAETDLANFQTIQAIMTMPILGRDPIVSFPPMAFVCSYFQWDYDGASVRPVRSRQEFLRPFVPGMKYWVLLGEFSSISDGAVAVQGIDWRLAFPPDPGACVF